MKIITFDEKYLDEMAALFRDVYSEPGAEWDLETSCAYLLADITASPEYCIMAVDDNGVCLGAAFCKVHPYYQGKMLFLDSIQVKPQYQKQKIGKKLFSYLIEKAKRDNLLGMHFLADERQGFPRDWYERMGFVKSGWTEFEAELKDIKV